MAQSSDFGVRKQLSNGHGTKATMAVKDKERATAASAKKGASKASTATATAPGAAPKTGVTVTRRFTSPGVDPLDQVVYERRSSAITNPDGSVVFKMEGAEVPAK